MNTIPLRTALFVVLLSTGIFAQTGERQILLAVSKDADPAVKEAAARLTGAPFFSVLEKVGGVTSAKPVLVESETLLPDAAFKQAAYNHLVLVGFPDRDPLLKKCWGNQIGLNAGAIDVLGYGKWKGDIGTVECDWNPFLYSRKIKTNPYTTLIIRISGTSAAGLAEAVDAFNAGILNGIVPAGNVVCVEPSILDQKPEFTAPPNLPATLGPFLRAGWTQPSAMEYRAYIDQAGIEPKRLWRVKYLAPGAFDGVDAQKWVEGVHRLAYGNAVTVAEFGSPDEAKKTWEVVGKTRDAKIETLGSFPCVRFEQPTDEAFEKSFGPVRYFAIGRRLIAVSLPDAETQALMKAANPAK